MSRKAMFDIGTLPDMIDNCIGNLGPNCEGVINQVRNCCPFCCCADALGGPTFISQVISGGVMATTSALMFLASFFVNPVTLVSTIMIVTIILLIMFKLK